MTPRRTPFARCPNCGASLDPGERCDCERREAETVKARRRSAARKARISASQNNSSCERAWEEWLQC